VSRRTFYELFPGGLDDGLIAVMDGGLEQVGSLVAQAFGDAHGSWQDGMRAALAAVLGYFDSERDLARVLVVEAPAAGAVVHEYREGTTAAFRALVVGRIQSEVSHPSPLAAEGLLGSVVSVVNARLIGRTEEPLIGLLGPLMGVIVGGAMDEAAIAREIEKGDRLAASILEQRHTQPLLSHESAVVDEPVLPPALHDPRAHRLRLCLLYVAKQSGRGLTPSNKEIGQAIGVSHRGQLGKLLGRLVGLGLLAKREGAPGHRNAWSATPAGARVASALAAER
jgi:hypothetical protein